MINSEGKGNLKSFGSGGTSVAQPAVRSQRNNGNATIGNASNDGPQGLTVKIMRKIVARIVTAKKAGEELVFMVTMGSAPSINHGFDTAHSNALWKSAKNRGYPFEHFLSDPVSVTKVTDLFR